MSLNAAVGSQVWHLHGHLEAGLRDFEKTNPANDMARFRFAHVLIYQAEVSGGDRRSIALRPLPLHRVLDRRAAQDGFPNYSLFEVDPRFLVTHKSESSD